jgi:hypothetical protein
MRILLIIILTSSFASCGKHDEFVYRTFEIDEQTLLMAIDSLFIKYPQYKVPLKWTIYDSYSYSQKRYAFYNERRFYFGPPIEEMYSVGIYAYGTKSRIAISAMHDSSHWHLQEDLLPQEIERIENRFDKIIISKLKKITRSKCVRED